MSEKEAVAWAVENFRHQADKLKKGYMPKHLPEIIDAVVEINDCVPIKGVASNPSGLGTALLRGVSAALLARDKQLPAPLASFAAASLQEPKIAKRSGRKPEDLIARDLVIGGAAAIIGRKWDFKPTRRDRQGGPCACSIVQEALVRAVNLHLSEANIEKALIKFNRSAKKFALLVVRRPELIEYFQEKLTAAHNQLPEFMRQDIADGMNGFDRLKQLQKPLKDLLRTSDGIDAE
jgi:hypothetical protein